MGIQCIYSNTLASVMSISKFASRKQPVFSILVWHLKEILYIYMQYNQYSVTIQRVFMHAVGQLLSWPIPSLYDERIH